MALFHLSVTQTKRSAGQSAIASAAYRVLGITFSKAANLPPAFAAARLKRGLEKAYQFLL